MGYVGGWASVTSPRARAWPRSAPPTPPLSQGRFRLEPRSSRRPARLPRPPNPCPVALRHFRHLRAGAGAGSAGEGPGLREPHPHPRSSWDYISRGAKAAAGAATSPRKWSPGLPLVREASGAGD